MRHQRPLSKRHPCPAQPLLLTHCGEGDDSAASFKSEGSLPTLAQPASADNALALGRGTLRPKKPLPGCKKCFVAVCNLRVMVCLAQGFSP